MPHNRILLQAAPSESVSDSIRKQRDALLVSSGSGVPVTGQYYDLLRATQQVRTSAPAAFTNAQVRGVRTKSGGVRSFSAAGYSYPSGQMVIGAGLAAMPYPSLETPSASRKRQMATLMGLSGGFGGLTDADIGPPVVFRDGVDKLITKYLNILGNATSNYFGGGCPFPDFTYNSRRSFPLEAVGSLKSAVNMVAQRLGSTNVTPYVVNAKEDVPGFPKDTCKTPKSDDEARLLRVLAAITALESVGITPSNANIKFVVGAKWYQYEHILDFVRRYKDRINAAQYNYLSIDKVADGKLDDSMANLTPNKKDLDKALKDGAQAYATCQSAGSCGGSGGGGAQAGSCKDTTTPAGNCDNYKKSGVTSQSNGCFYGWDEPKKSSVVWKTDPATQCAGDGDTGGGDTGDGTDSGLSTGAIVGIVAGVAALGIVAYLATRR